MTPPIPKRRPRTIPTEKFAAIWERAQRYPPCHGVEILNEGEEQDNQNIEFIADSSVRNATVASGSFSALEKGTTTAAVVSPPTMEAKMNDYDDGPFQEEEREESYQERARAHVEYHLEERPAPSRRAEESLVSVPA